jgi:hypothetical protein
MALRTASAVGFVTVALVVGVAVSMLHPEPVGGVGIELAAGPGIASGSQQTEPEGVVTDDPEASDEDGSGAPSWLAFAVIGAISVGFLVWYLGRLNRQGSAGGD